MAYVIDSGSTTLDYSEATSRTLAYTKSAVARYLVVATTAYNADDTISGVTVGGVAVPVSNVMVILEAGGIPSAGAYFVIDMALYTSIPSSGNIVITYSESAKRMGSLLYFTLGDISFNVNALASVTDAGGTIPANISAPNSMVVVTFAQAESGQVFNKTTFTGGTMVAYEYSQNWFGVWVHEALVDIGITLTAGDERGLAVLVLDVAELSNQYFPRPVA